MTGAGPHGRAIVVGVDGSGSSKEALRWAVYLARLSGTVVEAVTVRASMLAGGSITVPSAWNREGNSEETVASLIDELFGADRPVPIHVVGRTGDDVARVLVDESKQAMMLVVGNAGHGGLLGRLSGSVASKCAQHAECPVLVVPAPAP